MKRINVDDIEPGMLLQMDIFADSNSTLPMLRKGSLISSDYLQKLKERGVQELYIQEAESFISSSNYKDNEIYVQEVLVCQRGRISISKSGMEPHMKIRNVMRTL